MPSDPARLAAVEQALPLIEPGTVIGLGSGRAVFALTSAIGARWHGDPPLRVVAASPETAKVASDAGIAIVELDDVAGLDLAIDGADEIGPELSLIKGGGAALLREKLVLAAAERVVIIAEAEKRVDRLGVTRRLPVDIVAFGRRTTLRRLNTLARAQFRRDDAGALVVTADGHLVVDMTIPDGDIREFGEAVKTTLGVVEHGLFLDEADEVILGRSDGSTEVIQRHVSAR